MGIANRPTRSNEDPIVRLAIAAWEMPPSSPIAAIEFNHVSYPLIKRPSHAAAAPPHRTFPIVIGEANGCFSLHSENNVP
jgi:hypothetical protein